MDKSASKARPASQGISIRNGPVGDRMDIDSTPNGTSKRKARASIGRVAVQYKEESDSDDGAPLVRLPASRLEFIADNRGLTIAGQTSKSQAQDGGIRQR